MNWDPSDAQLDDLKAGWTVDGLTAGQLARQFGVTRNIVIGLCHRRGWIQPGSGLPSRARARRDPRPPQAVMKAAPPPPPKKIEFILDPEKFVVFDQLGPHHCRYPVDAGGKAGLYCGLMPNGTPYCDGHAIIVYQPHQPRKIKRPR